MNVSNLLLVFLTKNDGKGKLIKLILRPINEDCYNNYLIMHQLHLKSRFVNQTHIQKLTLV